MIRNIPWKEKEICTIWQTLMHHERTRWLARWLLTRPTFTTSVCNVLDIFAQTNFILILDAFYGTRSNTKWTQKGRTWLQNF